MREALLLRCLLAGLLILTAVPAEARRDGRAARQDGAREGPSTLEEAVSSVRRQTAGRVLSVRPHEQRRGTTYRIKVLMPDASVQSFDVEARDRPRRRNSANEH